MGRRLLRPQGLRPERRSLDGYASSLPQSPGPCPQPSPIPRTRAGPAKRVAPRTGRRHNRPPVRPATSKPACGRSDCRSGASPASSHRAGHARPGRCLRHFRQAESKDRLRPRGLGRRGRRFNARRGRRPGKRRPAFTPVPCCAAGPAPVSALPTRRHPRAAPLPGFDAPQSSSSSPRFRLDSRLFSIPSSSSGSSHGRASATAQLSIPKKSGSPAYSWQV